MSLVPLMLDHSTFHCDSCTFWNGIRCIVTGKKTRKTRSCHLHGFSNCKTYDGLMFPSSSTTEKVDGVMTFGVRCNKCGNTGIVSASIMLGTLDDFHVDQ